MNMKH